MDFGPDHPGRSPLPHSEGTNKSPKRVPGRDICRLTWMVPIGQVPAEKADTPTSHLALSLGFHLWFMSIQKQDQHFQDDIFSMSLLFKEGDKECHHPNSFTWNGLAFKTFHSLSHSLPLAHKLPRLIFSPTYQAGPLPGISLPLLSVIPNSTLSTCPHLLPDP